jgi:hypothetical protein
MRGKGREKPKASDHFQKISKSRKKRPTNRKADFCVMYPYII